MHSLYRTVNKIVKFEFKCQTRKTIYMKNLTLFFDHIFFKEKCLIEFDMLN